MGKETVKDSVSEVTLHLLRMPRLLRVRWVVFCSNRQPAHGMRSLTLLPRSWSRLTSSMVWETVSARSGLYQLLYNMKLCRNLRFRCKSVSIYVEIAQPNCNLITHLRRSSIAYVISEIAQHDFPENWPTLFDQLLTLLGTGNALIK